MVDSEETVIHILRSRATSQQMVEMLELWEFTIKLAVDIDRQVLVGGGELHTDCEAVLLEDGSHQKDIWGVSYIPETNEISYDSFINIRPSDKNYVREVRDSLIRDRIEQLVRKFLEAV
jgi:hypothetical protein